MFSGGIFLLWFRLNRLQKCPHLEKRLIIPKRFLWENRNLTKKSSAQKYRTEIERMASEKEKSVVHCLGIHSGNFAKRLSSNSFSINSSGRKTSDICKIIVNSNEWQRPRFSWNNFALLNTEIKINRRWETCNLEVYQNRF